MKKNIIILLSITLLTFCTKNEEHANHEHGKENILYTCSMDPQVIEKKPGKCPICKMDLTPISVDQIQSNGVKLSEQQVILANIKTKIITLNEIDSKAYATGVVKENENLNTSINAWVNGRIDKIYFKTKGAYIKSGQVIYTIYSEDLAAAQSDLINTNSLLLKNTADITLKSILNQTENKLKLWGITAAQIEQIKKQKSPTISLPITSRDSGYIKSVNISEGTIVMEGQELFKITDYSSFWIDAQFYANDLKDIQTEMLVSAVIEGSNNHPIQGKVVQILPQTNSSSTVNIVRISIQSNDKNIKPGQQANVYWRTLNTKKITVPLNAVIQTNEGATVWIKNKDGIYMSKMVSLGKSSESSIEILEGLNEGEEVVISGAYLLQSEYIFKKGINPMAGHDMSNM